jgi:hypothetical protein
LPVSQDVQKVTWAVSKKWWRSFGYDYVLAAIRVKFHKVIAGIQLILFQLGDFDSVMSLFDTLMKD